MNKISNINKGNETFHVDRFLVNPFSFIVLEKS